LAGAQPQGHRRLEPAGRGGADRPRGGRGEQPLQPRPGRSLARGGGLRRFAPPPARAPVFGGLTSAQRKPGPETTPPRHR